MPKASKRVARRAQRQVVEATWDMWVGRDKRRALSPQRRPISHTADDTVP